MVSRSTDISERPEKAVPSVLTYWRRRAVLLLVVFTVVFFAYMGITLSTYLTNPSYGVSLSARGAEWARDYGLGPVVTWVEQEQYRLNPPSVGGAPPVNAFGSGPTHVLVPKSGHLPTPARLISPAGSWSSGEGVWHVAGRTTVTGIPTTYVSYVRPDPSHTSYVAGVAWMDPTLLKAQLYSGSYIPSSNYTYAHTAPLTYNSTKNLVDIFNAGFRMSDARGGYYTDGHVIAPYSLRDGAASVVISKDGTMTVAKWGRDVKMGPTISSVRQNLRLIVDNSQLVSGLSNSDSRNWGVTLSGTSFVWRSGLGVTRNGALIYVAGPVLSIKSLAQILVDAGCVRGMELDINSDWVQYSSFLGPIGHAINGGNGTSLLSSMVGPPSRYFESWWTRDFFSMSLRKS